MTGVCLMQTERAQCRLHLPRPVPIRGYIEECVPFVRIILVGNKWLSIKYRYPGFYLVPEKRNDNPRAICGESLLQPSRLYEVF